MCAPESHQFCCVLAGGLVLLVALIRSRPSSSSWSYLILFGTQTRLLQDLGLLYVAKILEYVRTREHEDEDMRT